MLKLSTNREDLNNDILDEIKLFFPDLSEDLIISHEYFRTGNNITNIININDKSFTFTQQVAIASDKLEYTRLDNRAVKLSFYKSLSCFTGENKPYGSLTGIRPTKLVYDMIKQGKTDTTKALIDEFCVSPAKAKLISDIVAYQSSIKYTDNDYNLYIHIPFCVSKCYYCAFSTEIVARVKNFIPTYVELLAKEIEKSTALMSEQGKNIYSIYIGGGTPTALTADELDIVLSSIPKVDCEFTVEAGRPDTITQEKLDVLEKHGVNRICVNPQSFCDTTLSRIGRNHTIEQFYDAYNWAKGRFNINVDLIAGLLDENLESFKYSIQKALELRPDNLTVHTLSKKNGSVLKNTLSDYQNNEIEAMVNYAYENIVNSGYKPYYMYRQKQMLGNLENLGYTLDGKMCVNNVTTMEEKLSVMACGAGSISKRLFGGGRIERLANVRDTRLYISEFDARLKKKLQFFK